MRSVQIGVTSYRPSRWQLQQRRAVPGGAEPQQRAVERQLEHRGACDMGKRQNAEGLRIAVQSITNTDVNPCCAAPAASKNKGQTRLYRASSHGESQVRDGFFFGGDMKRHGNLFERIATFENLELAYRKAARGKRYRPDALRFHANLEENLIQLQNELIWQMYEPRPYRTFIIHEPKQRIIYAAAFRDRVVHHAIMNVLEPIWEGLFIANSYACRKGMGTHEGVAKLDRMLQSALAANKEVYCFKADVAKFFPNINHHILMAIIRRKIKCKKTLALLEKIVFANGDINNPQSRDLPIGNLISQWSANLYLNELDLFAKHQLKAQHYIRYMDDFIILHHDKRQLLAWQREIVTFLHDRLALSLNNKTSIFPASQGIDFLGYRTWAHKRLLRKSSAKRMVRRLKKLQWLFGQGKASLARVTDSVRSWVAHCDYCDSWKVRQRILGGVCFASAGNK